MDWGDGSWSVPLTDGRVLWLFGDSHVDDFDVSNGTMACLFQARNAALLQQNKSGPAAITLTGKGPGFRSSLKTSEDGVNEWLWPVGGFQEGPTVWVIPPPCGKQRPAARGDLKIRGVITGRQSNGRK